MATEKTNLTEQTVADIQRMITENSLEPGDIFSTEGELKEKLKVSRPVIREAVSRLRMMGLLESRQRVGLIVSKPDPVGLFGQAINGKELDGLDLRQLAEFRYALEIGAIELAVHHGQDEQLERLAELADEFAESYAEKTGRDSDDIELDFHRTILEATGNTMLMRMYHVLSAYFAKSQQDIYYRDCQESDIWEHRAIAKALAERNAERARTILAEHLSGLL